MAIKSAKLGQTVSYRFDSGKSTDAAVIAAQSSAPPAPDVDILLTGGTLTEDEYYYKVTAVVDGIETEAGAIAEAETTGNEGVVVVSVEAIMETSPYNRATAFNVYKDDGESFKLIGTIEPPEVEFEDDGSETPDGDPPTEGAKPVRIKLIHHKSLEEPIVATALRQAERYYRW